MALSHWRWGAHSRGMSDYLARKKAVVAELSSEYGISPIHASEVADAWEFEANRRGIDQRARDFWKIGRDWMARQVDRTRPTPGTTGQPHGQR